jgi:hypothetical protein
MNITVKQTGAPACNRTVITTVARRGVLIGFAAGVAACAAPGGPAGGKGGWPGGADTLGARLTSPLAGFVPLETALSLMYGARQNSYASLYNVSSSGQLVRLFDSRVIGPGRTAEFPGLQDPVIRLSAPAGAEEFVLVATLRPLNWLSAGDMIDHGPFPRLALDRAAFQARLRSALGALPGADWQVQSLVITTRN